MVVITREYEAASPTDGTVGRIVVSVEKSAGPLGVVQQIVPLTEMLNVGSGSGATDMALALAAPLDA